MKSSRRMLKLVAAVALGPLLFNHLACSSREISAALSSGLQTTLTGLFENFSENFANTVAGIDE